MQCSSGLEISTRASYTQGRIQEVCLAVMTSPFVPQVLSFKPMIKYL